MVASGRTPEEIKKRIQELKKLARMELSFLAWIETL